MRISDNTMRPRLREADAMIIGLLVIDQDNRISSLVARRIAPRIFAAPFALVLVVVLALALVVNILLEVVRLNGNAVAVELGYSELLRVSDRI